MKKNIKKIITSILISTLMCGIFNVNVIDIENVSADSGTKLDTEYTEWSTERTGLYGEISKSQYRFKEQEGYYTDSSCTEENNFCKRAIIYYIDNEYVILAGGKWLSNVESYGDNVPKNHIGYNVQTTVQSNKYGFGNVYLSGNAASNAGKDSTAFSVWNNFHCYAPKCGRTSSVSTNTININKNFSTINPYEDDVLDLRIVASGISVSLSSNDSAAGWRAGISPYGELQEYNAEGGGGCGSKGSAGNNSNMSTWCYENGFGNKTYVKGQPYQGVIVGSDGKKYTVDGANGDISLYLSTRSFHGDRNVTNHVNAYYLSLIERTYFISYTTDPKGTQFATTFVTPVYGDWSEWIDGVPTKTYDEGCLETRELYSHPKKIYVNYPTVTNILFIYDGNVHAPTITGFDSNTMAQAGVKSATAAGEYEIIFTLKDPVNYAWIDGKQDAKVSGWRIRKANSDITNPPTGQVLTYTGTAQELVLPGSTTGGTMYYSLDKIDWSPSIPTGIESKIYTIYYKCVGDSNHEDYDPDVSVDSIIQPMELDSPVDTTQTRIYSGTNQNSGMICPTHTHIGGTNTAINAGQYSVSCELDSTVNYKWKDGTTEPKFFSWRILSYDIKDLVIAPMEDHIWEGTYANYSPVVTATIEGITVTLKEGVDYTYKWENVEPVAENNYKATQIVTITGKGNLSGALTATYKEIRKNYDIRVIRKIKGTEQVVDILNKYYNEKLLLGSAIDFLGEGYNFVGYTEDYSNRTVKYKAGEYFEGNKNTDLYILWRYAYDEYDNMYFAEGENLEDTKMETVLGQRNYYPNKKASNGNVFGAEYLKEYTEFTYSNAEGICRRAGE